MDKIEMILFYSAITVAVFIGRFEMEAGLLGGLQACALNCGICDSDKMGAYNFMFFGRQTFNDILAKAGDKNGQQNQYFQTADNDSINSTIFSWNKTG